MIPLFCQNYPGESFLLWFLALALIYNEFLTTIMQNIYNKPRHLLDFLHILITTYISVRKLSN